jgi:2,3-bisphosphoglycerate-dependent phosphoglycerate mutase
MFRFLSLIAILFLSCRTTTYYVIRHAEKEAGTTMTATTIKTSDVPLSVKGERRAGALKNLLINKSIQQIWSTNTIRTRATVQPYTKEVLKELRLYSNDSLQHYISAWKEFNSESILIVGHSNTVDDIVNGLKGDKVLKDLPDSQYGDLFIIQKKRGLFKTKTSFQTKHFGE